MRRNPKRSDGKKTFSNLLKSACELFATHGYHGVSVPMISKKAGVKPSTFYQYFNDKEAIYEKLISDAFNLFTEYLGKVNDSNAQSIVESFIRSYVAFFSNHTQYFRILHEAVYLKKNVHKKLESILRSCVIEKLLPKEDEKEAKVVTWFVTGPIRFASIFKSLRKDNCIEESMVEDFIEFALSGIDTNDHILNLQVFSVDVKPLVLETNSTKARLLQAAEKLFGKYGYRKTMISDITKSASVAAGTFYVYFPSKEAILEELVMTTNRNLRLTIASVIKNFPDRRDSEIAGYNAFLRFFLNHSNMYLIVRQAEFFNPDISRAYYEKIFNSYLPPLTKAIEAGMFKPFKPENLAIALMGIGHFMGEDLVVYSKTSADEINDYLSLLSEYLFKGVLSRTAT
ncbi:TetR/AcrR family transcriptional regulator [Pseudothermotoga sp.]|nr:TetR/AcrR family transcriptional regulator [Pseudothermotoga sp.]MCX7813170.1 TetR/AcrR family transcriptional regulator [Pseudothermotoga sp.]MDW8140238.1 TetR/AcrR family transcriptional regulator [Pseudothermotoga sp.]